MFTVCVVEWESGVGLWDQLVQETLATSVGGSAQANDEQDGASGSASIDDQRTDTTKRLDQGLRRAEAPAGQVDATPQTELGGWCWGGGSAAFTGWPSRNTSGSPRLSSRGRRSGRFEGSCCTPDQG